MESSNRRAVFLCLLRPPGAGQAASVLTRPARARLHVCLIGCSRMTAAGRRQHGAANGPRQLWPPYPPPMVRNSCQTLRPRRVQIPAPPNFRIRRVPCGRVYQSLWAGWGCFPVSNLAPRSTRSLSGRPIQLRAWKLFAELHDCNHHERCGFMLARQAPVSVSAHDISRQYEICRGAVHRFRSDYVHEGNASRRAAEKQPLLLRSSWQLRFLRKNHTTKCRSRNHGQGPCERACRHQAILPKRGAKVMARIG